LGYNLLSISSIFALGGTIHNPSPPWKIFLTSKFPNSIIENIKFLPFCEHIQKENKKRTSGESIYYNDLVLTRRLVYILTLLKSSKGCF